FGGTSLAAYPTLGGGGAREVTSLPDFGIRSGARPSGRPTPMRPFRSGCGSTDTAGPSVSWISRDSVPGARQWLPLVRRSSRAPAHLQSAGQHGGADVLLALVPPPALARLPSLFTVEDLQAGYVYELAFRPFEVS